MRSQSSGTPVTLLTVTGQTAKMHGKFEIADSLHVECEIGGGWISLAPGPHFIDVALPGGASLRLTVVTPVESSGYQVVPKP